MPSTLLLLRRQAGYRSSREFAEKIGVPAPTYTRYESNPDKIPLKNAWAIADELGCSIDAVVGRASYDDAMANRGEVQIEYDALSDEGRELMDDMRQVVQLREKSRAERRRQQEGAAYAMLCSRYLLLLAEDSDAKAKHIGDHGGWGDAESYRATFEEFVARRAEQKRERAGEKDDEAAEQRDAETLAHIMEAFDRIHSERRR